MNDEIVVELPYNEFKIGVTAEGKFVVHLGAYSKECETYREATKAINEFIFSKTVVEPLPVFIDIGNFHYERGIVVTLNMEENQVGMKRKDGVLRWEYIDNLFLINSETETLVNEIMECDRNIKREYETIDRLKESLEHNHSFEQVLNKVVKK